MDVKGKEEDRYASRGSCMPMAFSGPASLARISAPRVFCELFSFFSLTLSLSLYFSFLFFFSFRILEREREVPRAVEKIFVVRAYSPCVCFSFNSARGASRRFLFLSRCSNICFCVAPFLVFIPYGRCLVSRWNGIVREKLHTGNGYAVALKCLGI